MKHALILALSVLVSGCLTHTHLDRGRPGFADLDTPPAPHEPGRAAPQRDPGEHVVALMGGPTPSGGLAVVDGAVRGSVVLGAELTANRGENPSSHNEDDFFLLPRAGYGASLGGALRIDSDDSLSGPLYAEAQIFDEVAGVAGGWSLDPILGQTGPQATVWWGPLFLRGAVYLNGTVLLTAGSQLKVPLGAWVWSR